MSETDETKIIYHIDDENTPYLVKLPIPSDRVTLADFKNVLTNLNKPNYKFYFKSMDDDIGVVKEEIDDEATNLPCFNGRVISWLVAAESSHSSVSDGTSNSCLDSDDFSRPPPPYSSRPLPPDDLSTTETESVINPRRDLPRNRRNDARLNGHSRPPVYRDAYDSSTTAMSSEYENNFLETDEDGQSRFTSQTERSVAARILKKTRRRRRRPFPRKPIDRASSFSSVTDSSMSLNIITVTLSMDNTSFLGISIVGQTHKQGDGGIYVGTIMPGGAVAQDGRIEPGDMILQVNDVSFENMPNDDAVKVLREVVNRPGPIKLVVAKCWNPNPRSYFTLPKNDPVRPIDPGSWVEATRMMSGRGGPMSPSVTSMTSDGSTLSSSIPDSERGLLPYGQLCLGATGEEKFPPNCDIISVIRAMQHPASGLDIKDRMWLKITIPNAFLGHNLVGWLFDHIDGFTDRREARKYASKMLKDGYIKHTTGKLHFSEQCYYIFNQDLLIPHMNNLSLRDPTEADEEKDQLCPLPQYSNSWIPPQYTGYQPRTAGYSMGELEMFGPNQNSGHSSPGSSSDRSSKELVKTEFL
uniref:Dishevelled-2 n=1 Tax=Hofstenia miamia TaxID=442651 RepID=A0A068CJY0_HOFMI|nr:dishevelled-2 [Hofstenia miamia]